MLVGRFREESTAPFRPFGFSGPHRRRARGEGGGRSIPRRGERVSSGEQSTHWSRDTQIPDTIADGAIIQPRRSAAEKYIRQWSIPPGIRRSVGGSGSPSQRSPAGLRERTATPESKRVPAPWAAVRNFGHWAKA